MLRLLRNVHVIDPLSPLHDQTVDLLLDDGVIARAGQDLDIEAAEVLEVEGLHAMPGGLDIGAWVGDPGFEHREDFDSLSKAAAAGGFTEVAVWPNTEPVVDGKAEVAYVARQGERLPVAFHAIGALTRQCAGTTITEMLDMRDAGTVAFSDGLQPVRHAGVLLRAMLYVLPFDGLVINQPFDDSVAPNGQMHEGRISTLLGLKGMPPLAETLMVQRDLDILRHTGSRLLVHGISSAESVARIRRAKEEGLRVYASVPLMNLLFTEDDLASFDTRFKVVPPLRTPEDRAALIEGLRDGTIDLVTSNHLPVEAEHKECEFAFAEFGASTVQHVWYGLRQAGFSLEEIVELMALRPRQVLGLPVPTIATGRPANLVLCTPHTHWTFGESHNRSRSSNDPFLGSHQTGSIRGMARGRFFTWIDE